VQTVGLAFAAVTTSVKLDIAGTLNEKTPVGFGLPPISAR
jgi:hypothetical protein